MTEAVDLGWIRMIVNKRLKGFYLWNVSRDDLISAGMEGYCKALRSFDPSKGVSFRNYCVARIQGSAMDELRKQIGDERIKNKKPISVGEYNFDNLINDSSEYASILFDNKKKNEENEELEARIQKANLTEQDKKIIILKLRGLTHKEIGAQYGRSDNWSHNHYTRICVKLKSIHAHRG
jgi:RNA polymerase sigma factor (sigma-70 family)